MRQPNPTINAIIDHAERAKELTRQEATILRGWYNILHPSDSARIRSLEAAVQMRHVRIIEDGSGQFNEAGNRVED